MSQLPPEARIWGDQAWPVQTELLAQLVELVDAWGRAMTDIAQHKSKFRVPGPVEILRPGEEPKRRRLRATPGRIAEFFARVSGRR